MNLHANIIDTQFKIGVQLESNLDSWLNFLSTSPFIFYVRFP